MGCAGSKQQSSAAQDVVIQQGTSDLQKEDHVITHNTEVKADKSDIKHISDDSSTSTSAEPEAVVLEIEETKDDDEHILGRRRALSANNEHHKIEHHEEAQKSPSKHARRRLSIMGRPKHNNKKEEEPTEKAVGTPRNRTKSRGVSISSDGGIGNGAEGVAGVTNGKLPIEFACLSRPGNDPMKRQKNNQDAYCVHDNFGSDDVAFSCAVLDGHGPNGGLVSAFVRDNLHNLMLKKGINNTDDEKAIKRIIHNSHVELNHQLLKDGLVDVYVSGTTCVSGIIKNDLIYTSNVGDSRAVLARLVDGKLTAIDLSEDQKPDRPDEKERIVASGGRVFEWGVPRVWRKEVDMPGLAMARSFGDQAAETVGVFAEPETSVTKLNSSDEFIIFASDGVWEFMSSQEAVDLAAKHMKNDDNGTHKACVEIIKASTKYWLKEEDVVDDSTVVILKLDYN